MQSRQMLGKLLNERIVFYARDGEAEFVARASVGRLIKGLVVPKAMVAPTGYARKTVDPLVLTFEAVALAAA